MCLCVCVCVCVFILCVCVCVFYYLCPIMGSLQFHLLNVLYTGHLEIRSVICIDMPGQNIMSLASRLVFSMPW